MTENELILKARQGDRVALAELVALYQGRLRAYAARYVESSDDVFDIVQDTFLDALRHLETFDANRELGPWLRGICRNRVLNYFRARSARRSSHLSLVDTAIAEKVSAAHDEPSGLLERIEALRLCLNSLGEEPRQLMLLRYDLKASLGEISARLKRSSGSIAVMLMRIRASLVKCVDRRMLESRR